MPIKTILKLVLASLVVGLALTWFGVTPADFWGSMGDLAARGWRMLVAFIEWGLMYIVVGATVVVPLYLVQRILGPHRSGPDDGDPGGQGGTTGQIEE